MLSNGGNQKVTHIGNNIHEKLKSKIIQPKASHRRVSRFSRTYSKT